MKKDEKIRIINAERYFGKGNLGAVGRDFTDPFNPDPVHMEFVSPAKAFKKVEPYIYKGKPGLLVLANFFLCPDEDNCYFFFKSEELYRYAKLGFFEEDIRLYLTMNYEKGKWTLRIQDDILNYIYEKIYLKGFSSKKFIPHT